MKKSIIFFKLAICIICIFLIIYMPGKTIEGVKSGVNIVLYSMLPSLMPFILIINFLVSRNLCQYIAKIFHPVVKHLFKLSLNGCFVMICGFFSGFPIGCKTVFQFLNSGKISKSEAKLLLTFCNNASISFIINYIAFLCFDSYYPPQLFAIFIFLPSLITGIINARIFFKHNDNNVLLNTNTESFSVMDATLKSLTKIAFFIIIFSVILSWFSSFSSAENTYYNFLLGFLEIMSGTKLLTSLCINKNLMLFVSCIYAITGGICITFQSISFFTDKSLYKYYFLGKLESVIIFIFIFLLYFYSI